MSNFWSKIDQNLLLEAMLAILRPTWGNIMASWVILEATWSNMSQHGANMSQHGANMGPTWGQLEGWGMSSWVWFWKVGHVILRMVFRGSQLGANIGQVEPTWSQLGPNMSPTWAKLEPTWPQVGPRLAQESQLEAILKLSWGLLSHAGPKVIQHDQCTIPRPGGMRGAVE